MKRSTDLAPDGSTTAPDAANEDFAAAPAFETIGTASSSGWDPYEVWRTRVKDELELPELTSTA